MAWKDSHNSRVLKEQTMSHALTNLKTYTKNILRNMLFKMFSMCCILCKANLHEGEINHETYYYGIFQQNENNHKTKIRQFLMIKMTSAFHPRRSFFYALLFNHWLMYTRLFVPKGRKAEIQAAAEQVGETLNEFIVKAIDERLERQKSQRINFPFGFFICFCDFVLHPMLEVSSLSNFLIFFVCPALCLK